MAGRLITVGGFHYRGRPSAATNTLAARQALVSGSYDPGLFCGPGSYATNRVGIFGPETLTALNEGGGTNLTFSTANQVISNTVFYRRVSVGATGITFNNCLFLGGASDNTQVFTTGSAADNTTLNDCTITAQAVQQAVSGLKLGAGKVTLNRCDIYGTIDGIAPTAIWTGGVFLNQCAIHHLAYISPDPGAIGGINDNAGHVDGIQMVGGTLSLAGTSIYGYVDQGHYQGGLLPTHFGTPDAGGTYPYHMTGNKYASAGFPSPQSTSCIMMSPTNGDAFVTLQDSFFQGAAYPINGGGHGTAPGANSTLSATNCKIGSDNRYADGKLIIATTAFQAAITLTGNTRLETGAALSRTQLIAQG